VYLWRNLQGRAMAKEHYQMTQLATSISANINNALQAQSSGKDLSFMILQPADGLLTFAQTTENNEMAALALLKRAEALRAELHYRMSTVTQQDLADQIGKALQSYTAAIEKAPSNPNYVSLAKYGQGLCAEEIGDYDKAGKIYQGIVANPDFESTVAYARAKYRLKVMDDFKQKITFKPAPASAMPTEPPQLNLLDSLGPLDANKPLDSNKTTESNEPAVTETPDNAVTAPDANASGQ